MSSTVIRSRDSGVFMAAFGVARNAGAEPCPVGGNEFTLPDSTPFAVLYALAAIDGVTVSTDRPEPPPAGNPRPAKEK